MTETSWTDTMPTAGVMIPSADDFALAAAALLAEIDQRVDAGVPPAHGYRLGSDLLAAVRTRIENDTGVDLSEWRGPIVYRDVPLFRSMVWTTPLGWAAR